MDLFTPLALGELRLRNRIVMAPMTRSRSDDGAMPNDLMVEYYRQRASAGLIVTEGVAPNADGLGYCRTPGLYSQEQVTAWRKVTDAVHAEGGTIVAQLMHVGRVSNHFNKPAGAETVAPSAIAARGDIYTDEAGMQAMDAPRALSISDIAQVIADYRTATENAFDAGFDGVELHCTSGYLPAQFLSTGSNHRGDEYGGSVENRCRFVLEVLTAISSVSGAGRVGMRICPDNPFNDLSDDNPQETFSCLLEQASTMELAYLHVIRMPSRSVDNIALGQRFFADRLIGNDSYGFEEATQAVADGELSAVSFGRSFIANPDLPERWAAGSELTRFDPGTLYTPGSDGYTSYSKS
ncbi:MAG: alkene reductase [Halioglobus sp.]